MQLYVRSKTGIASDGSVFEWLWEELFGDEDYHLPEGDYEIVKGMPDLK